MSTMQNEAEAVYHAGDTHVAVGRYKEAMNSFERALEIATQAGDQRCRITVLSTIARLYLRQGKFDEAVKTCNGLLSIVEPLGDPTLIGDVLESMAWGYYGLGNRAKMLELTEKFQELGKDIPILSAIARHLAGAYHGSGGFIAEAIDDLQQAGTTYKQMNRKDEAGRAYLLAGQLLAGKEKYVDATDYLQNAAELFTDLGQRVEELITHVLLANVYQSSGDTKAALDIAKSALQIADKLALFAPDEMIDGGRTTPRKSIAQLTRFIAQSSASQGEKEAALEYYLRIIPVNKDIFTNADELDIITSIANCHQQLGTHNSAIQYYEKAMKIVDGVTNDVTRLEKTQEILNWMADSFKEKKEFKKAKAYVEHALEIGEKLGEYKEHTGHLKILANSHNNMARIHDAAKDYDAAISSYTLAAKLAEQAGDVGTAAEFIENIAYVYYNRDDSKQAIVYFRESAEKSRVAGLLDKEMERNNMIGNCLWNLDDLDGSMPYYQKALVTATQLQLLEPQRVYNLNLANLYRKVGREREAIEHYERTIALARDLGKEENQAQSLLSLAILYSNVGKSENGVAPLRTSLEIYKKLDKKEQIADIASNLGILLKNSGQFEEAIKVFRLQIDTLKEIGKKDDVPACIARIGNCYSMASMPRESLEMHMEFLRLSEEQGNRENVRNAHYNIGMSYKKLKEHDKAIHHYEINYRMAEEDGKLKDMEEAIDEIASIFYDLDKEKAITYYLKRAELGELINDPTRVEDAIRFVAKMHYDLKHYEEATKFYLQGVEIAKRRGDKDAMALGLTDAGYDFIQAGKLAEAIPYYLEAIAIRESTGNKKDLVANTNRLALTYFQLQRFDESFAMFTKKLELLKMVGAPDADVMDCHYDLGNVAVKLKRFDDAVTHYEYGIEIAEKVNDISNKAGLLGGLASAYKGKADWNRVIEIEQQRLVIADKFRDWKFKEGVLERLANAMLQTKRYRESMELFFAAAILNEEVGDDPYDNTLSMAGILADVYGLAVIAEDVQAIREQVQKPEDRSLVSEVLRRLGAVYVEAKLFLDKLEPRIAQLIIGNLRTYLAAKPGIRDTLDFFKSTVDAETWAEAFTRVGRHYLDQGRNDAARRFFDDVISLLTTTNKDKDLMLAYHLAGTSLKNMKKHAEAREKFQRALDLSEQSGDAKEGQQLLFEIGDGYFNLDDFPQAKKYIELAHKKALMTNDGDIIMERLRNLCFLNKKIGQLPDALAVIEQGVAYAVTRGDTKWKGRLLNEMGSLLIELGIYDQSVKAFQEAMDVYKASSDYEMRMTTTRNLAYAYDYLKDFDSSLDAYAHVVEIMKAEGKESEVIDTLNDAGGIARKGKRFDRALALYNNALDSAKAVRNKAQMQTAHNGIGRVYMDSELYEEAMKSFTMARNLCDEIKDERNRQFNLGYLGKCSFQLRRLEDAINYYLQAADVNRKLNDLAEAAENVTSAAWISRQVGKIDKALEYYTIAAEWFARVKNLVREDDSYGSIAMMYSRAGNYDKALVFFTKAKELNEHSKNDAGTLQRMWDIANTLNLMGDTEKPRANEQFLAFSEFAIKQGNYNRAATGFLDAAYNMLNSKQYERAIEVNIKALDAARKAGNKEKEWNAYQNLGSCHRNLDHLDAAIDFYTRAIEVAREMNHLGNEAFTMTSIGRTRARAGDYKSAISIGLEVIAMFNRVHVRDYELKHDEMADTYIEMAKWREAAKDLEGAKKDKRDAEYHKEVAQGLKQEKEYADLAEGNPGLLFSPNDKILFLVGAGISMNPPSSLASARVIVRDLLEECAPPEEVETLLDLKGLRYELLVEVIKEKFDKDLRFMDYFESVLDPNIIHLLCAKAIIAGHDVITTNFDYLIEMALRRLLPASQTERITPIITVDDFTTMKEPEQMHAEGRYPLYKLHGSCKNIITGVETKETLITTISSLGKGKEAGETFTIEPFKRPAVNNLAKGRTLVVMGYSGSDDFDIGPTLKILPDLTRIIWINHVNDPETTVFKVKRLNDEKYWQDKFGVYPLLAEIRHDVKFQVYRINTNTATFIKNVLWKVIAPSEPIPDVSGSSSPRPAFKTFISKIFTGVTEAKRYLFAGDIFDATVNKAGMNRVYRRGLEIVDKTGNLTDKVEFISRLAFMENEAGNVDKAIGMCEEARNLCKQTGNHDDEAVILITIGSYLSDKGHLDEAISTLHDALRIIEEYHLEERYLEVYTILGSVHRLKGSFIKAMDYFSDALKRTTERGNLSLRANVLTHIGLIHHGRGNFDKEMEVLDEALKISVALGDLNSQGEIHNNMGLNLKRRGKFDAAIKHYQESLELAEKAGSVANKIAPLLNIALVNEEMNQPEKNIEYNTKALALAERINHKRYIAVINNNIGMAYYHQKKYQQAHEFTTKALRLYEELGNPVDIDFVRSNLKDVITDMNKS